MLKSAAAQAVLIGREENTVYGRVRKTVAVLLGIAMVQGARKRGICPTANPSDPAMG